MPPTPPFLTALSSDATFLVTLRSSLLRNSRVDPTLGFTHYFVEVTMTRIALLCVLTAALAGCASNIGNLQRASASLIAPHPTP